MTFEDLGLGPKLVEAVKERGYTEPTPIQAQAIPQILMMRDVVGLAQTGTGKTASFILPMLEILHGGRARARMPRSLILTPTRELAAQIAENFDIYGKYHKLSMALLIGGTSMDEQIKRLDRGVDVLIATPGRLLDLFERGNILLNDIKIFVIDEADRMLDMGFIPDIEKIVSFVPPLRQTLLFSATMPPEIKKLSDKFLSNPKQISVATISKPAESVEQMLVWVNPRNKKRTLTDLIASENLKNAFIFCNRKRDIAGLEKHLKQGGYSVAALHGDMAQASRMETLQDFKDDKFKLLICSDVAARGLDVPAVSHVFNYDVPMNAEDYVHRIGRTGRAGMTGKAWTLAAESDRKFVDSIEKLIKRPIPVVDEGTPAKSEKSDKPERQKETRQEQGDKSGERKDAGRDRGRGRGRGRQRDEDTRNSRKSSDKPERKGPANDSPEHDDTSATGFGDDMPDFMKRR